MRQIVDIDIAEVAPGPSAILSRLGVPPGESLQERTVSIRDAALDLFGMLAAPAGILVDIEVEKFTRIYRGLGHNEPETPVEKIFPRAARLALFIVTLGEAICGRITETFAQRDFALASMLDAAASEGTEKAAEVVERRFSVQIEGESGGAAIRSLRYSPGYCGWHVSGQQALLAVLEPEEIGITLRESYLMQPLKSISGVIVAGLGEIHDFEDGFPFCDDCQSRGCRERIRSVLE